MKSCGCNFCNDLRNIQPAKYIGLNPKEDYSEEVLNFFKRTKENKSFLLFTPDNIYVINKCPECGYEFTEEDYDSYD